MTAVLYGSRGEYLCPSAVVHPEAQFPAFECQAVDPFGVVLVLRPRILGYQFRECRRIFGTERSGQFR